MRRENTQKGQIWALLVILIVVIAASGCTASSAGEPRQEADLPVEQPGPSEAELKVGDTVWFTSADVVMVRELIDWNDVSYYVATKDGNALIGMSDDGRLINVGAGASGKVLQISGSDIKVRLESGESRGKQGWADIDSLSR